MLQVIHALDVRDPCACSVLLKDAKRQGDTLGGNWDVGITHVHMLCIYIYTDVHKLHAH